MSSIITVILASFLVLLQSRGECTQDISNYLDCPLDCIEYGPKPVCGSNGRTYDSPCKFRQAECFARLQGASLTIRHYGACRNYGEYRNKRAIDSHGQPNTGGRTCPHMCNRAYNPVCGSDGEVYSNPCILKNARECEGKNVHRVMSIRCLDSNDMNAWGFKK